MAGSAPAAQSAAMTAAATRCRLIATTALAATLGASTAGATAAPATCFPAWSEALPIVQREALTSASALHTLARQRNLGDLVRITLCTGDGRFVYHLLVREPRGRVVSLIVDARHPFSP